MTPVDVLNKAKEILKVKNLNKGYYAKLQDKDLGLMGAMIADHRVAIVEMSDAICVGGALLGVGANVPETAKAMKMFAQTVGLWDIYDIPKWNDRPETTKEMVLEALELTIRNNNNVESARLAGN